MVCSGIKWFCSLQFPPLFNTKSRYFDWNEMANSKGTEFVTEALKNRVRLGHSNRLILCKQIQILKQDGSHFMDISSEYLIPKNSKTLKIVEENETTFTLALLNPPKNRRNIPDFEDVINDIIGHFYPNAVNDDDSGGSRLYPDLSHIHHEGPLLSPDTLSPEDLRYLVGYRPKYFWNTCQKLDGQLIKRKKLDVPQQLLLHRMKVLKIDIT